MTRRPPGIVQRDKRGCQSDNPFPDASDWSPFQIVISGGAQSETPHLSRTVQKGSPVWWPLSPGLGMGWQITTPRHRRRLENLISRRPVPGKSRRERERRRVPVRQAKILSAIKLRILSKKENMHMFLVQKVSRQIERTQQDILSFAQAVNSADGSVFWSLLFCYPFYPSFVSFIYRNVYFESATALRLQPTGKCQIDKNLAVKFYQNFKWSKKFWFLKKAVSPKGVLIPRAPVSKTK